MPLSRSFRPLLERLEERVTPVVNPTLTYNGGTLLANVQVEGVYYKDPTSLGLQPSLDNFFKGMVKSRYVTGLLNRFSDGGFTIGAGAFVGDLNNGLTIAPGGTLSDASIEHMLSNELAAHKIIAPTKNTLYFVFAPAGVEVALFGTNSVFGFLGYHSSFVDPATQKTLYYAVMPFPGAGPNGVTGPDGPNADLGIEAEFSLGLNSNPLTKLQSLTGVSAHEFAEAITDPGVGNPDPAHPLGDLGWLDTTDPVGNGQPGGFEIGDLANGELATYNGFVVQEEWGRKLTDPPHKATGQVVAPSDTDFMITAINNPTEGNFNGLFATFVDRDGAAKLPSAFAVTVDWGDGTISASNDGLGDVAVTSNHNGTFNILGKHNYGAEAGTSYGTYPYNFDGAQVFITSGSEVAWNKPRIVLQDSKLTSVTGLNFTGSSGHALNNQRVATFVDAQGTDGNKGEYHATINWGDGSAPDNGTIIIYNGAGKYSVFGSHHVYSKPGVYTVKTTILHGGAQFTATASGVATVAAAAASNQTVGNASKLPQLMQTAPVGTRSDPLAASLSASSAHDKAPGASVLLANDAVHLRAIHSNQASSISEDADLFGAL
jgi:hypothetical protein